MRSFVGSKTSRIKHSKQKKWGDWYASRDVIIRSFGFTSYSCYLRSVLWDRIRERSGSPGRTRLGCIRLFCSILWCNELWVSTLNVLENQSCRKCCWNGPFGGGMTRFCIRTKWTLRFNDRNMPPWVSQCLDLVH